MILKDKATSHQFEINVVGYQYNEPNEGYLSWLHLQYVVSEQDKCWKWLDPSITISEAVLLVKWLRAVVNSKAVERYFCFLEPNLSFELVSQNERDVVIRVILSLENIKQGLIDSWNRSIHEEYEIPSIFKDFDVSNEDLLVVADSLLDDLRKLPVRIGIDIDQMSQNEENSR